MTLGESFAPKALSRTAPTPIALRLWSWIRPIAGSRYTPMTELIFATDANSAIDARGLPTCSGGRRAIREPRPIKGCGKAIVGEGTVGFDFYIAEALPIPAKSKLILYNGGAEDGVTTLFAYTYFAQPFTTTLVMPIQIEAIQGGGFANRTTVTVPKVAGGSGSLTSFDLKIRKDFVRKGERVSVLTAKCPAGKLHARAEANFADGTSLRFPLVRACVPRD
jgi:hypothetical protein